MMNDSSLIESTFSKSKADTNAQMVVVAIQLMQISSGSTCACCIWHLPVHVPPAMHREHLSGSTS